MLVVHHLNSSRSQRVLWLLEELGIGYEVKHYQRDPQTLLAPPELKQVHPLGKSPVLVDGNTTVAESGAIIEYLIERHGQGRLRPSTGSPERLRYTYWMHYAEGSAMPPLLLNLVFSRIAMANMPFFIRPVVSGVCKRIKKAYVEPQLRTHLAFIESELEKSSWFAGDEFTAADIQMSFPAEAAAIGRPDLTRASPRLMAYLARVHARPAYQRALEAGGSYDRLS